MQGSSNSRWDWKGRMLFLHDVNSGVSWAPLLLQMHRADTAAPSIPDQNLSDGIGGQDPNSINVAV